MKMNIDHDCQFLASEYRNRYGDVITIEQLTVLTGASTTVVKRLVAYELLQPQISSGTMCFDIDCIFYMKKILRLHHDLGVSWSSMPLVLELLERIDVLESHISQFGTEGSGDFNEA